MHARNYALTFAYFRYAKIRIWQYCPLKRLIFQRDTAFQLALRLTMRCTAATLAFVALLFSAGLAWADFDDGMAAAQRGDYAK